MNEFLISDLPKKHDEIVSKSNEIGFTMPSDLLVGNLLKTLVASKPAGNFLEIGTGIGLSLSWMIEGMDQYSKLITIDDDFELIKIATNYFGDDERVNIVCEDGSKWIQKYSGPKFDLVFADAWPGKYSDIESILNYIKPGGFYVIDDMMQQPNWPEGHDENVNKLVAFLEQRTDFTLTKMNWSTGLIIAVKKN